MQSLVAIYGECHSGRRFQTKLCLSESMFVTRESKALLVSAQLTIPICANTMHKQVHSLRRVKRLFHLQFCLTTSSVHSSAIETTTTARCRITFSFTEMVSVTQWDNKLLISNLSNWTRFVRMSMVCFQTLQMRKAKSPEPNRSTHPPKSLL